MNTVTRSGMAALVAVGLGLTCPPTFAASKLDPAVQQLIDRGEIENLLAEAVFSYDRHDCKGFGVLFAPDGEVQTVPSKLHPDAGQVYKGNTENGAGQFVCKNTRGASEFGAGAAAAGGPPGGAPGAGGPPAGFGGGAPGGAAGAGGPPGGGAPGAGGPPAGMGGGMMMGNGVMHHIVTSNYIKFIDATHARHYGYWMLNTGGIAGVYSDQLVKLDGKWKFQVRKIHYDTLNPEADSK